MPLLLLRASAVLIPILLLTACVPVRNDATVQPEGHGSALIYRSTKPFEVTGVIRDRIHVGISLMPLHADQANRLTEEAMAAGSVEMTPHAWLQVLLPAPDGGFSNWTFELDAAKEAVSGLWIGVDADGNCCALRQDQVSEAVWNGFDPEAWFTVDLQALWDQRCRHDLREPIEVAVGGQRRWLVRELGIAHSLLVWGVSVFTEQPRPGTRPRPDTVWFLGTRGSEDSWRDCWHDRVYPLGDQPAVIVETAAPTGDSVPPLVVAGWQPTVEPLLAGQHGEDLLPKIQVATSGLARSRRDPQAAAGGGGHLAQVLAMRLALEQTCNDRLIEWKNRDFAQWLGRLGQDEAIDLQTRLEKGVLRLDLTAKSLRDEVDAMARDDREAPASITQRAHLIEQRKAILMALAASVKRHMPR